MTSSTSSLADVCKEGASQREALEAYSGWMYPSIQYVRWIGRIFFYHVAWVTDSTGRERVSPVPADIEHGCRLLLNSLFCHHIAGLGRRPDWSLLRFTPGYVGDTGSAGVSIILWSVPPFWTCNHSSYFTLTLVGVVTSQQIDYFSRTPSEPGHVPCFVQPLVMALSGVTMRMRGKMVLECWSGRH